MATKYICDKCGSEYEIRSRIKELLIPDTRSYQSNDLSNTNTRGVELCYRCYSRLNDWLQPDPKEYNAKS
jgi:hypothetical protein